MTAHRDDAAGTGADVRKPPTSLEVKCGRCRWPTARWETAGDAAAVAFWRVLTAGGIRHVRPRSWWQWLFWRSSTEETRALAGWRQKHPDHPLAGVAETLAQ